ncbi:protein ACCUMULATION AND REPLICATION OF CHLOROPLASTS 3 isoform X2 [Phalaenopsis equestris]|uniref:protein ACCUMULATION AND REPLICATION OF CHLOROPLASTS 3 isoform X2 n=1 Tax=Phalaenopsis equestris TaxID=78828 RepID=UPI0009E41580|nr:protein ACCUMULATION AND REPLICATION OF CHLOROPLASTS 3 isoform X2 [Phalaenopsis equestris]
MEFVAARASHAVYYPSIRPQCRTPPTSLATVPSGFWCRHHRRQRTLLPTLCIAQSLDPHSADGPVDVIGIGSRKDSIIDFFLASPAVSASRFRFWTIYSRDQKQIQLLERCHNEDVVIRNVEFPAAPHLCLPATILVASAGHDLDQIAAVDLLYGVKAVGGLAIAIVLKPFSFEGQTRQKEINDLVNKLKLCSNFYVVEADSLLKAEIGTLAEALESANNTVFIALNTISSMISKTHASILYTSDGKVEDIKPSEVIKVLEGYGEMKIFHGTGYSVNSAIMQAIFHCPFFDNALKDLNGLAIIVLTSACNVGESDIPQIISSFRWITSSTGDIIYSKVREPNLEPKLVVVALLILGSHKEKIVTHDKGFLHGILQNLPFFFRCFRVDSTKTRGTPSNGSLGNTFLPPAGRSKSVLDPTTVPSSSELVPNQDAFCDLLENATLRNVLSLETTGEVAEPAETNYMPLCKCGDQTIGEELGMAVAKHGSHEIGPAFYIAQLWAKKCSATSSNRNDNVGIFSLPVGVKSSKLSPDSTPYSNDMLAEHSEYINQEIPGGISADMSKKEGLLSVRAAMMLEAERESMKSWNPVVEIQYRGGIYRGRCQSGLPVGKGRLTSMDGSFYDGFWKSGKRSGLGTYCYSNGDLFRGSWRDDLMHGKGWFYFHTGDRLFANFWRGKANGEGRFFSKNGSVFFGFFRDGWRHGQSMCIEANGARWTEHWDDGVLVSRTLIDKED